MIKYTILYKNGKTWNGKCTMLRDIGTHKLEPRCGYDIPVWVSVDNKTLSDGDIVRFMLGAGDSGGNYTSHSTYRILGGRFMMLIDVVYTSIRPTRTPNPASVTKKQKKFDEEYVEWAADKYSKAFPLGPGGADCSKQAYKKWLWEQKQAELKSVLKETSLDEFVRVDVPDGFSTSDGWIPWHGGECPVPGDAKVEVKFRCGETNDRLEAGRWRWGWGPGDGSHSIVAYRLLGEDGKPIKHSKPKKLNIKVTIQLPGQIDPVALPITIKLSYDTPIKTTYTFWLEAFGEID